jgi:tetratricopeptide (TPR) repeat protein
MVEGSIQLTRGRLPLYCGPEAISAVMAYHGTSTDVEVIARNIIQPGKPGSNSIDLTNYATKKGFRVDTPVGSIGALRNAIDSNLPAIISLHIRDDLFHYFVVVGYNKKHEFIICLDYSDAYRALPHHLLLKHWHPTKFDMILIQGGSAEEQFQLGGRLESEGRHREAVKHYREAILRQPEHVEARVGLGNCLRALGKMKESRDSYEEAVSLAPTDSRALNNLADLLLEMNEDLPRAVELAGRAVKSYRASLERTKNALTREANPRRRGVLIQERNDREIYLAFSLDTLAKARFRNGDAAAAAAAWKASLDLLPLTYADYRARRMLNLARANKKIGMASVARDWLSQAAATAKDAALLEEIKKERK